jgi:very-short-patch-repair endonuclease
MTDTTASTSLPKDARVAWIAARQHGVISYAQLIEAGLTEAGIKHRVSAGWLHRVHRGVFAVGHAGLTPRGLWAAAVLSGGDGAALSHRSAAALWGIWRDGDRPAITSNGVNRRCAPGVETHVGRLRAGETLLVDGIRVTKVARTLLDLAEVLTLDQLVRAIDNATAQRHLRPTLMSSMIKQSHGRRGLKPLKQALLITRPEDVLTRSELERRALRLIEQAQLPRPEVNVRLHGYEVDLLWRDAGLVVELDGSEYHDPEHDTRRDNTLRAHGWSVSRFTWRQIVNDPGWVVACLRPAGAAPRAAASSASPRSARAAARPPTR